MDQPQDQNIPGILRGNRTPSNTILVWKGWLVLQMLATTDGKPLPVVWKLCLN